MRTVTFLASALALTLLASACTTETAESPSRTKTGKTTKKPPKAENGEHAVGDDDDDIDVDPGTTIASGTWEDGKTIAENGTINAGEVVTIAPGATINLGPGVTVIVKGTLKVDSAAKHAKLTGTGWGGLLVSQGGKLEANGLDIEGAKNAIWTETGGDATIENGVIKAESPFKMDAGSKLTVTKTNVTATAGSTLAGTFTASYLDYDKGVAPGLTMNDAAGTFSATDSNFHGTGKGGDFIISSGAKSLTLAYTKVANSHCGLHFNAVDKFTLDHVTIESNDYGAMLYGSGAGPHEIKDTNFLVNAAYDADIKGTNGPINATGSLMKDVPGLTQTAKATGPVTGAGPR
ncbi:MAG: hypothetical protein KIT84_17940 [Labilithrix sp.]|nr:hypothetical protein [Labilithrix sp.]MCW5812914.1 hypothetical protein [Labilithrix sp.]